MTQPRQSDLERKLITVASGKGGVGKTVFAVTLSHALARMGRDVLLFDGDLGLANVDIQLGLMPQHDVADVISGDIDLAAAAVTFTDPVNRQGRLDIIAGRSGSGALSSLTTERLMGLKSGLTALCGRYDHVVLDLAAGVEAGVQLLANNQGTILVVLAPDPTSLTDAYAFIKLAHLRNPEADIRIVVNLAQGRSDGEQTYEALRRVSKAFLNFEPPLAGILRADQRVTEAIRHQAPILSRHPQADFVKDICVIAKDFPVLLKALAG
jgi:flagellar biosynthesis protein FlhG